MIYPIGIDIGVRRVTLACGMYSEHAEYGWTDELDLGGPSDLPRHEELNRLTAFVWTALPQHAIPQPEAALFIEKTYVSHGARSNPTISMAMAQLVGSIMGCAEWYDVELVVPSSWQAKVVGNGRADKAEIREWLANQHPDLYAECHGSQDRVDAMCISLYGRGRILGEILAAGPKKRPATRKAAPR